MTPALRRVEERLPWSVAARVPGALESAAAKSMALGYGIAAGAVYGLLRDRPRDVVSEGVALGLAAWAAGYLGWLPALGLMPPVGEQDLPQVAGPVVQHLAFGVAAAIVYRRLRR